MSRHPIDQPLRAGFTLVELAVGIAVGALVGLLVASLAKAGLQTNLYALQQAWVLNNARIAIMGDGAKSGMSWSAREANSVTALSSSKLSLGLPSGPLTYSLCPDGLCSSQLPAGGVLAYGVSTMTVTYYNLGANGEIMASASPSSVALVSGLLQFNGAAPSEKVTTAIFTTKLENSH